MKNRVSLIIISFVGFLCGCADVAEDQGLYIFSSTYDFSESLNGWEADFTDYPAPTNAEADSIYRWNFAYTEAPESVGGKKAIMISCNNESGDLFMFIKKKVGGFQPNTDYTIVFEVELATDAPSNGSVILKAGATSVEPKKIIEGASYSINIDKGSALTAGEDVIVLGDVGGNYNINGYTLVKRSSAVANNPFLVRSNSKGEIWLLVGTDSGYKGFTTIYYTKVSVVFSGSN